MDYNTQRSKLIFPEYGRHIHKMVDYCKHIPDKDERTRNAYAIVALMGSMHPHLRDVPEFNHKLWNHLAILSDFELDIEWPFELPKSKELVKYPEMLEYSDNKIGLRHYGKNIEKMLVKINDVENEDERNALITQIANHMKKLFFTWKKEHVDDKVIFNDIVKLTRGALSVPEGIVLQEGFDMYANVHQYQSGRQKKKKPYKKK